MPRRKRKQSKTNTYHVMIRGNERKNLFLDDNDRIRFIDTLYQKKEEDEYELYAYCLMDNHVHLLMKENKDDIARVMKRINTSYAYYFNKKYKRIGHVFQDRFKSEEIESDGYLLEAARYIHNNPVKASIARNASEYKWSSYKAYLDNDETGKKYIESEFILKMFSSDKERAKKKLIEYTNQKTYDVFIEYNEEFKKEEQIINVAGYLDNYFKENKITKEAIKSKENLYIRTELIKELKNKTNLSIREIADILTIDRNIVQRA